jgi:hypothetical protein
MPRRFWLNYALCWVVAAGFWWWLQVGYFYRPIERLKFRSLEFLCLVVCAVLVSIVSDSEFDSVKINPGLKQFFFKILGPTLKSKFGIILPILLIALVGFLFFQDRQLHLSWANMPSSAHVILESNYGRKEITEKFRNEEYYVLPMTGVRLETGVLEIRDEYGFFRTRKDLRDLFSWGRFLTARNTEISEYSSLDEVSKPIQATVNFVNPEKESDSEEGCINPATICWKKFSPTGGVPAFFASVADAYADQKKPLAVGVDIIVKYENVNYKCRFINRGHLEIIDADADLTAAILAGLIGKSRRIVEDDNEADYSDFCGIFAALTAKSKNKVVEAVVADLGVAPGWQRELTRNQIVGMGKLLVLFTRSANELSNKCICLLFTNALPLFDEYLGEQRIIMPMSALMRLSATIFGQNALLNGEGYQNLLLARFKNYFRTSTYNVIKFLFIVVAKRIHNDFPTKTSIAEYISCLKFVLDGGDNYVRSVAAELVSDLRKKWQGNAQFAQLYDDFLVSRSRWRFTKVDVGLRIKQGGEKASKMFNIIVAKDRKLGG